VSGTAASSFVEAASMVDTRFHLSSGPSALRALLDAVGEAVAVDDERFTLLTIAGASELDTAGPEHIALAASKAYLAALRETGAGAVIVIPSLREHVPASAIPIVVAGETMGLLVFVFADVEPHDEDNGRLLTAVSAAMGFALLRDRLAQELREAAGAPG